MLGNGRTSTSNLLGLVLGLLDGLARVLLLLGKSVADKSVLGLELSHGILVIVNQAKARGLATTKLGSETKQDSQLGIGLVHASYNFLELRFWHIRSSWVNNVNDHLIELAEREREILQRENDCTKILMQHKKCTGRVRSRGKKEPRQQGVQLFYR